MPATVDVTTPSDLEIRVTREIAAPERLVHTEIMDGMDGEVLCTQTLVESGARTTMSMTMLT